MYHGKAFPKFPDGRPQLHNHHAYQIENRNLVKWFQTTALALGVEIVDATVTPERGEKGIEALVESSGKRWTADLCNRFNALAWDDIRDFLSVHDAFNTRLNTPFWVACRNDTKLHGAAPLVQFYRDNGPSTLSGAQLIHSSNSFGMDGYLTLLLGKDVPHAKPYTPPPKEAEIWRNRSTKWHSDAQRGLTVQESLAAIRKHGFK